MQSLFGFQRVHVKAGETVTVDLYPARDEFAQDPECVRFQAEVLASRTGPEEGD